jgi:hypothetical protein
LRRAAIPGQLSAAVAATKMSYLNMRERRDQSWARRCSYRASESNTVSLFASLPPVQPFVRAVSDRDWQLVAPQPIESRCKYGVGDAPYTFVVCRAGQNVHVVPAGNYEVAGDIDRDLARCVVIEPVSKLTASAPRLIPSAASAQASGSFDCFEMTLASLRRSADHTAIRHSSKQSTAADC